MLLFLVSLGFGANYFQPRLQPATTSLDIPETLHIIGIMAQFQFEAEDNPTTSGRGNFLSGKAEDYINFYDSEIHRCEGFLVDRPPHDSRYFINQLIAVGNYYNNISDENLPFTKDIILNSSSPINGYFTVSHEMEYYARSDQLLAEFFTEALNVAADDIDSYFTDKMFLPSDVVFVVFHAGLGQDFSVPYLYPTIYDLKSAYIDENMMGDIDPANILGHDVNTGILLPETQNMIYFDVVEDIFGNPDFGTEDLCDIQMGLTGTFAFLLGYELGLPPLFNTDTGDPGVGFFGLMDHGSNNGRGVIPAPPVPFTRILTGWSTLNSGDIINPFSNGDSLVKNLSAYDIANKLIQIDITEDEYFLIENRNNWVFEKADIDSLRRIKANKVSENQLGHWFDTVIKEFSNAQIEVDDSTGVITRFNHYDYGLPGSGILIWHITESSIDLLASGINNNKYNRHVHLEEADGAVDIGFKSYAFFASDNPTTGTRWDMWFKANEGYKFANPGSEQVIFDNGSNPNSRSSSGAESFLSIKILDEISDYMEIEIQFNDGVDFIYLSEDPVQFLGGDSVSTISAVVYYEVGDKIVRHKSDNTIDILEDDFIEGSLFYSYEGQIEYLPYGSCIHPDCDNLEELYPTGFLYSINDSVQVPDALSLGDLDLDGLDEIITIEFGDIIVKNSNGTLVNGFPAEGNFSGIPLIANIISIFGSDEKPEIICREGENGENIVILSNRGERLREFASLDYDQPLALVPNWDGKIALVDGQRLLLFEQDLPHSYWLNPQSQPSGYPLSSGVHEAADSPDFGRQKAYNYPNPVTEGKTTFRYFVHNVSSVQIKIYDAAGFLIETLKNNDPTSNEFNETQWQTAGFNAGLYLAEIKPDIGQSELVRMVLIK